MGKSVITLIFRFPLYFFAGNTMMNFGQINLFYPIIQVKADRKCQTLLFDKLMVVGYLQYGRLMGSCQ